MLNLDQCALENESNAWRAVSGASPEDNSLYFGIFFSRDSADVDLIIDITLFLLIYFFP